jgi:hypothetical protein
LGAAFRASAIKNIERVRLLQRSNAPVYLPVGTVGCQSDLRHRPVERPTMPGAPVYRLVCGDVWYHIDGASGAALEKLDSSRRAYRWFYSALHTLDIPVLMEAPEVCTVLIIALCALGLAFSLSGVVIGWRRLRVSSTRRL